MDMLVKAADCWIGEKISGRVRYEWKIHHGMFRERQAGQQCPAMLPGA